MSENIVSYDAFVRALFNRQNIPSADFTHAILGVVTEIHEYLSATDEVNGLEELGDLEFYVEALKQVIEDHVGPIQPDLLNFDGVAGLMLNADRHGAPAVISDICNTLLDDCRRWVGYGKEPKSLREVLFTVNDLVDFVNVTGPYPCTDQERVEASNRAKLNTRYQNGVFTQQAALQRNLEAERASLASH